MRLQLTISGQKHWDHAASMQPLLLHLYPVRLPRVLPSITRGSNPIPYLFPFFSPLFSLFYPPNPVLHLAGRQWLIAGNSE